MAPSLMNQKEVEEHEREHGWLCLMESGGRKFSFSVKSRDLEAKSSLKSSVIFISRKGKLMKGVGIG